MISSLVLIDIAFKLLRLEKGTFRKFGTSHSNVFIRFIQWCSLKVHCIVGLLRSILSKQDVWEALLFHWIQLLPPSQNSLPPRSPRSTRLARYSFPLLLRLSALAVLLSDLFEVVLPLDNFFSCVFLFLPLALLKWLLSLVVLLFFTLFFDISSVCMCISLFFSEFSSLFYWTPLTRTFYPRFAAFSLKP